MRIGLIARCDDTGLGIQSKEFFDHIPCKALLIDSSKLASQSILTPKPHNFPGQQMFQLRPGFGMTGGIPRAVIDEFLNDVDLVFAMETPYDYNIFSICRDRGIKTVLQLNYEFLDYPSTLPMPDLFAAPSMWFYDNIHGNKRYLPVPVNTKVFKPQRKHKVFVHNVGRPAIHDRNGSMTFMNALKWVKNEITVVLNGQYRIPVTLGNKNVNFVTDWSNKQNYYDNYTGGVLVMPRKYGGLCLPFNEAIGAEMPIITTDISPNNTWLPSEWLVQSNQAGILRSKKIVPYFDADPIKLAEKIDEFCDESFYNAAVEKAIELKNKISWETLLPEYMKTFEELC